jgi:UDP-glucose:(heptosyl)LPS alpha-1,3-glucosyltransferase
MVPVGGPSDPGSAGMWVQRARTRKVLSGLDPRLTVTMGSVVPPGDVLWVPSVHRAWLEAARTIQMGRVQLPARVRFAMPRHRTLLAMESQYFRRGRPRHILCTSRREVDDLARLYQVDPALTAVVPNPFDPERFNPERRAKDRADARRDLGVEEHELALVFIANELHRKGFGQVLEAMALNDDHRMALHVVGKAGLGPYQATIHRLGLDDRVSYHGPSSDVSWHLAAADLMVLPTQYEPFGLVIVEALASGVPVITSRLAGASEAIRDGRTGLLLDDPYDVQELATLLDRAGRADLDAWGAEAASSVASYRRDHVMREVERIIFS